MIKILAAFALMIVCMSCGGLAQDGAMIRAYKNFEKGDYEDVLTLTGQAQSYKEPSRELKAEILFLRGLAFEKLGRNQEAEGVFKFIAANFMDTEYGYKAEEKIKNHDDTWVYYKRGVDYVNKGQFDMAIAQLNKAIELNSDYAPAYLCRGFAYGKKDQVDKAISDSTRSIELDPYNALVYYNRGCFYGRKGDFGKAVSDFNKSISLNPRFAPAFYDRGYTYKHKNQIDDAIYDFTRSIELNPEFAPAYYERASVYMEQNQVGLAVTDFQKVIELNPNHVCAHNDLAYLLATCPDDRYRDGAKAIELAEKALEISKDNYAIMGIRDVHESMKTNQE